MKFKRKAIPPNKEACSIVPYKEDYTSRVLPPTSLIIPLAPLCQLVSKSQDICYPHPPKDVCIPNPSENKVPSISTCVGLAYPGVQTCENHQATQKLSIFMYTPFMFLKARYF